MNSKFHRSTSRLDIRGGRGCLNHIAKTFALISYSLLAIVLMGAATNAGQLHAGNVPSQLAETNPPAVEQYYPVDSGVHWVGLVLDRGAKVKLEDGSLWEIAEKDQFHTRDWRVAQKITVSRNPNSRHPFVLTNTDLKATADARLAARSK